MTETVIYQSDEGSLTLEQLAVMRRGRFAGQNTELLLIEAIEALHADNQRLAAIASGNFENTQLIDTSLAGGEFSISLAQGPVPYLVEYLAQMLGHRHLEKPLNYSAIDLTHREFGPMTLTLQRKTGKSLQTIAGEHLKGLREVRKLLGDAAAAKMFIDDYLATLPLPEDEEVPNSVAPDGTTKETFELSADEQFLLEWLGREEFNQYGECYGKALDSLVRLGLAQLGEVPAKGEHFRTVWLTPAGIAALGQGDGKREIAS